METKINLQLPIIGKELLKKLSSKQINEAEFDKECAYWMTGDISAMYYKETHKPDIITNYEYERGKDPHYEVAPSFWHRDDVRDYLLRSHKVESENFANWYWLKFMKRWIPKEDVVNQGRIARAIASYPRHNDGYIPKDDWRNK